MALRHPAFLWLLPALAVLVAWYVLALRRVSMRGAIRYPTWIASEAAEHASPVRRHLPAGVFLLAMAVAIVGAAGPVVPWWMPSGRPVVLIIDVSRSMEEPDIPPSRIEAAKVASLEFVSRLREGITNLTTQLRTQLGPGLMEGIRAVVGEGDGAGDQSRPGSTDLPRAVAILLSDGRASDGVPPLDAAAEARRRGVRVYTVGVGTTTDPSRLRSGYWGVLDEPTLRAIASETGGEYFHAASAGRLATVYRDLVRVVGWEKRPQEITAVAAVLALALLVASLVLQARVSPLH